MDIWYLVQFVLNYVFLLEFLCCCFMKWTAHILSFIGIAILFFVFQTTSTRENMIQRVRLSQLKYTFTPSHSTYSNYLRIFSFTSASSCITPSHKVNNERDWRWPIHYCAIEIQEFYHSRSAALSHPTGTNIIPWTHPTVLLWHVGKHVVKDARLYAVFIKIW